MKSRSITIFCVLGAAIIVVAAVLSVGLWLRLATDKRRVLPTEGIDRVRVTKIRANEVGSTTRPELIDSLIEAILNAKRDRDVYPCGPPVFRIELFRDDELLHSFTAHVPLFGFEGAQYRSKKRALKRVVPAILSGLGCTTSTDKRRYTMGETVEIIWTITNYSDAEKTIPGKIDGKLQWYKGQNVRGTQAWSGSSKMVAKFSTGRGQPVMLKPDEKLDLLITVPTKKLGGGKTLLNFRVVEDEQSEVERPGLRLHDVIVYID